MKKKYYLLLVIIFFSISIHAQKFKVDFTDIKLNKALIKLRDKYGINISFNDNLLSTYKTTVNKKFYNTEDIIKYILKPLPLAYSINKNTFIIYPITTKKKKRKKQTFLLSGKVIDETTKETLPFTNILINNTGTSTNQDGYFSILTSNDSTFKIKISHLGYYILDTSIIAKSNNIFKLKSSINQLNEIVVSDMILETFLNFSGEAGIMKLNNKVSKYLPGNSDNSLFTTLNLQPGITATNEQAQQFSIFGSLSGQSRLYLDDFIVFGLKNFNINISSINPFIVKDIEILKAGYNAKYGECVGGIIYAISKDGSPLKHKNTFSISNYTLNNYLQLPINKNNIFNLAVRTTYRELYKNTTISKLNENNISNYSDVTVVPNYSFKDLNIKYIHKFNKNSNIKTSILIGSDLFKYNIDERVNNRFIYKNTSESNIQTAGSIRYYKNFNSGISTNLIVSRSSTNNTYSNIFNVKSMLGRILEQDSTNFNNSVNENTLKNYYTIPLTKKNSLNLGFTLVNNNVLWKEDSSKINLIKSTYEETHFTTFIMDNLHLKKFNATCGIRLTRLFQLNKNFFEPRITLNYKLKNKLTINGAIGIYKQYLTKSSLTDTTTSTTRYIWTIANDKQYPVLSSFHTIIGLNKAFKNTQINIDLFYKKTYGITQFIEYSKTNSEELLNGNSRQYGLSAYIKQNYRGQTFWASYTLSKNQELFPDLNQSKYTYSPIDQLHELKLVAIFNYKNLYLSSDYIYGSGFPILSKTTNAITRIPYNRLDISLNYKYNWHNITSESGLSIINVFNTSNYLYNNLERVPSDQINTINIYKQALPFTPSIYIKLIF